MPHHLTQFTTDAAEDANNDHLMLTPKPTLLTMMRMMMTTLTNSDMTEKLLGGDPPAIAPTHFDTQPMMQSTANDMDDIADNLTMLLTMMTMQKMLMIANTEMTATMSHCHPDQSHTTAHTLSHPHHCHNPLLKLPKKL